MATDEAALAALKAASVSADWELAPGATDVRSVLDQIDSERPHVLVIFGEHEELITIVRARSPSIRIVSDRDAPGATVVATSLDEVRGLVLGLPRPGGPVGA
ncbi:MAG: hypothetical protein OEW66_02690 [Actinomycetota bacterium]|nr:hypothetical protein [Actinomycetota bacterium]